LPLEPFGSLNIEGTHRVLCNPDYLGADVCSITVVLVRGSDNRLQDRVVTRQKQTGHSLLADGPLNEQITQDGRKIMSEIVVASHEIASLCQGVRRGNCEELVLELKVLKYPQRKRDYESTVRLTTFIPSILVHPTNDKRT
jgi:hypothetical protein